MSDWTLTLGLQNLRNQVNDAFPDRDRASDGTIGDAAHQAGTSGHNPDDSPGNAGAPEWDGDSDSTPEVRAWDMDSDLRTPGVTAQQVVDHIRKLPGVSSVLRYMIYNRKIYQASNGWAAETYTGASAHTEHIHFSGARTQSADNNITFDFHLEDLVALTAEDIEKIGDEVVERLLKVTKQVGADGKPTDYNTTPVGRAVLDYQAIPNPISGDKTSLYKVLGDTAAQAKAALAAITALAGRDLVDEQALAVALTALIVPALPDGVEVTEEQLTAAVLGALRELAAPAA